MVYSVLCVFVEIEPITPHHLAIEHESKKDYFSTIVQKLADESFRDQPISCIMPPLLLYKYSPAKQSKAAVAYRTRYQLCKSL